MGHQGPFVVSFDPEYGTKICQTSGFRLFCQNFIHWNHRKHVIKLIETTLRSVEMDPGWAQDRRPSGISFVQAICWGLLIFIIRKPYEILLALDMHWLGHSTLGAPGGIKSTYGAQIFSGIRYMTAKTVLLCVCVKGVLVRTKTLHLLKLEPPNSGKRYKVRCLI